MLTFHPFDSATDTAATISKTPSFWSHRVRRRHNLSRHDSHKHDNMADAVDAFESCHAGVYGRRTLVKMVCEPGKIEGRGTVHIPVLPVRAAGTVEIVVFGLAGTVRTQACGGDMVCQKRKGNGQ